MRGLRGAMVALAGGLLAVGGALAVGACGDDTTGATGDSGADTGGDVAADTTTDSPQEEAQADSPSESSQDAPVPETGPSEAGKDATNDAADAGDASDATGDAPFDASALAAMELAYANAESAALCQWTINCCPGGLDSGTYSLAACESSAAGYGWEANLPSDYGLFSRGFIAFDPNRGNACVQAIQALPCGNQTAAQYQAVTQACEFVFTGTLSVNSPTACQSSFECADGGFCDVPTDGGPGACTPLATQGQPCNTAIMSTLNPIPDEMCSYLGSSNTGLFCDLLDAPTAGTYGTCQPLRANGVSCVNPTQTYYDDQACTSGQCSDSFFCGGPTSYPYPAACQALILDAGAGGG